MSLFLPSEGWHPEDIHSQEHEFPLEKPNMRILITGCSGFIGSHFVDYFLRKTDYDIVGIDSFWHKGTYSRLDDIGIPPPATECYRWQLFHHDLSVPIDPVLFKKLHTEHIDAIINLASNSAVERSISNPAECWRNNTDIILNMLEFAKYCTSLRWFIQISTDEVYGDAMSQKTGHREWDKIVPSNPYAASKAAQEALCIAYWRTYKLPAVIINCMNCIGERQDPEKFLPKIINSVYNGIEVPIYCDEEGVPGSRVYLDCQNFADAINHIFRTLPAAMYPQRSLPSRYNICGKRELTNLELAEMVATVMQKKLRFKNVKAESARPGYDRRYFLDGSLMENLGWYPLHRFEDTLERIVQHALNKPEWIG